MREALGRVTRSRGLRAALWALLLSPLLYLGVCVVLGIGLAESTLRLPTQHVFTGRMFRIRMNRQFEAGVQSVSLTAADGVRLSAWWVTPQHPNGRAVLLLHGIGGNRVDMSGFSDIFVAQGYSVLLPDSRGHGESGGRVATFGLLESDDVRRWTAWVRSQAPGCTYLLGESMGAAIAVQATAVTPQLCAAAVEDPFARFRPVVYERLGRETGLGTRFWQTAGWPIVRVAIGWAHLRYRVWLPDARPDTAVQHSTVPVLFMTGTADNNIPMHHAQDLETACGSRCALWIVPGAAHGGISTVRGAEFGHRILVWFQTHDTPGAMPVLPYAHGDAPMTQTGPEPGGRSEATNLRAFHSAELGAGR